MRQGRCLSGDRFSPRLGLHVIMKASGGRCMRELIYASYDAKPAFGWLENASPRGARPRRCSRHGRRRAWDGHAQRVGLRVEHKGVGRQVLARAEEQVKVLERLWDAR